MFGSFFFAKTSCISIQFERGHDGNRAMPRFTKSNKTIRHAQFNGCGIAEASPINAAGAPPAAKQTLAFSAQTVNMMHAPQSAASIDNISATRNQIMGIPVDELFYTQHSCSGCFTHRESFDTLITNQQCGGKSGGP